MEIVLAIATLVGGVAAVVYFLEWLFRRNSFKDSAANHNLRNEREPPQLHPLAERVVPLASGRRHRAPRFTVGRVQCDVYMGLMGGLESYGRDFVEFDYQHMITELPPPVKADAEAIIAKEARQAADANREFYNTPCIRLHDYRMQTFQALDGLERKRPLLRLRPTTWRDYTVANRLIDREILVPGRGVTTVRQEYADEYQLAVSKDISAIKLSNILTTTIVLVTSDKWTLVGRRTAKVDNAPNVLAASAAENMHRWLDEPTTNGDPWSIPRFRTIERKALKAESRKVEVSYQPATAPNPFFTALRGVEEEIAESVGRSASADQLTLLCIAWDLAGFNPYLFFRFDADMKVADLVKIIDGSRAPDSQEASVIPVRFEPVGALRRFLIEEPWAEISKAGVLRALADEYGYNELEKALA